MHSGQSSLKSAVQKSGAQTAALTTAIIIVGTFAYYFSAQVSAIKSIEEELAGNIDRHIEQIIPSFLLPEQRGALPYQLDRIKTQTNASRLLFLESLTDLPADFINCSADKKPSHCATKNDSEVGILAPIQIGAQSFGYLFEAKAVRESQTFHTVLAAAITSVVILAVFLFILFFLFHKIMARKLPRDLDSLLQYVQGLLQNDPVNNSQPFEFSDFAVLQENIGIIFDNYKQTQNQAIVGHFATGVLHDIKTQLQSIVVASELAEEAKGDRAKYDGRLENLQRVIQKNLPDLQVIIKSTLDANKEITLNLQQLDIGDTIGSAIEYITMQEEFRAAGISVEKTRDKFLLSHDRAQTIRLFFNLIKNAIEAQKEKAGNKQRVLIRINEAADKIVVRVEDSGPGFKVAVSEIFDPFVTTKKYGVGFGLHNAKKIVAAHGWKIAASMSEQLGGACFEVAIPKEVNP